MELRDLDLNIKGYVVFSGGLIFRPSASTYVSHNRAKLLNGLKEFLSIHVQDFFPLHETLFIIYINDRGS